MNHAISLQTAIQMTSLFRSKQEDILDASYRNQNILARCESFDRSIIDKILSQAGCKGLRIYNGMDTDLKIHAIIVGYDEENKDMLPVTGQDVNRSSLSETNESGDDDDEIAERGIRCPVDCPPESALNP